MCVPSHLHPAPLPEDTVLELDQNPRKPCHELSRLPLPLEEFISLDKVLSGFSGAAGDRPRTQQHVTPALASVRAVVRAVTESEQVNSACGERGAVCNNIRPLERVLSGSVYWRLPQLLSPAYEDAS